MTFGQRLSACACLAAARFSLGACAGGGGNGNAPAANATANVTPAAAASPASGTAPAETGVEKVKPAPGTGNVQGKVLFNGKPAAGIEVKLCEKFNQFFGGCSGQTFTAKSDEGGEYVITNVAPKTYESLMARVFDTDSYVFATTGLVGLSSAKYEVAADKPLPKGEYRWQMEAYNAADQKLAESARDFKFTVTDGP